MEFNVAKKIVEIKFDYRLMFKIDKDMATKDANGQSAGMVLVRYSSKLSIVTTKESLI